MEKSTVYFTDFRCPVGTSQLDKLKKLCIAAGIKDIDMEGKFVAIKMHFGELGNMAFLRPNYAKVVADLCKEQGGLPFLTDCNTLYPGSRKNALEHLDCANLNGFNTVTTGCQIIIGDGLRGTDEVEVPVVNGEYCKTALIGHAIMDADIFISLSHFKGHEATGFGGALKNIGMGCGSRAGKMQQHASGKPAINTDVCMQDIDFYEESNGGVTISGGEGMAQPEFLEKLVLALKEKNLHVAIETTGYIQKEIFQKLAPLFDLLLFDVKHYDRLQHFGGTGVYNDLIVENLQWAIQHQLNVLPRIPVIPDFNDSLEDAQGISELLKVSNIQKVQLLPFHQFGEKKYDLLNKEYSLKTYQAYHEEDLKDYQQIFLDKGIDCFF